MNPNPNPNPNLNTNRGPDSDRNSIQAFQRNIEGHRFPCDAEKQTWCRLHDIQHRAHEFEEWRKREMAWSWPP